MTTDPDADGTDEDRPPRRLPITWQELVEEAKADPRTEEELAADVKRTLQAFNKATSRQVSSMTKAIADGMKPQIDAAEVLGDRIAPQVSPREAWERENRQWLRDVQDAVDEAQEARLVHEEAVERREAARVSREESQHRLAWAALIVSIVAAIAAVVAAVVALFVA